MEIKDIQIAKIRIEDRYRKEMGDITALTDSIAVQGLLQPIGVYKNNQDYRLLYGHRRLLAFQRLDRGTIPSKVFENVDDIRAVEIEYDENNKRKQLTFSEKMEISEVLRKPLLQEIRKKQNGNLKQNNRDRSDDPSRNINKEIAQKFDFGSGETYKRAKTIWKYRSAEQQIINNDDIIKKVDTGFWSISKGYWETLRERVKAKREIDNKKNTEKFSELDIEDKVQLYYRKFQESKDIIKDNSIDLVITDPPYADKYLYLFEDLSKFSKRVLKKDGYLITYISQLRVPTCFNSLGKHLHFFWNFTILLNTNKLIYPRKINCDHKNLVVFSKNKVNQKIISKKKPISDIIHGTGRRKTYHEWEQNKEDLYTLIDFFSNPGDIICDPMVGSGTTGIASLSKNRKFVGIDNDQRAIDISKNRLYNYFKESE